MSIDTEPMSVTINATDMPYDVTVKAADGRALECSSIKWQMSIADPMPRATLELDMVAASFECKPDIILGGLRTVGNIPLPDGLTAAQVRQLASHFGALGVELDKLALQQARLLRELQRRDVSADAWQQMLDNPEADMRPAS